MGRPKGSKNKPKNLPIPDLDTEKIQKAVYTDLKSRVPASEWQPVKESPEEKEKTKQGLEEAEWWRQRCQCTHSHTGHKTVGMGKCIFCECTEFK